MAIIRNRKITLIICISIYQRNLKNNSFLDSFVKSAFFLQTKLQKDGAFHLIDIKEHMIRDRKSKPLFATYAIMKANEKFGFFPPIRQKMLFYYIFITELTITFSLPKVE